MAEPHHGQIVLVGSLNAGGWWGAVCSVEPTGGLWSVYNIDYSTWMEDWDE